MCRLTPITFTLHQGELQGWTTIPHELVTFDVLPVGFQINFNDFKFPCQ